MIFHHFYQPNLSTVNLSTIFHLPHGTLVLLIRNISSLDCLQNRVFRLVTSLYLHPGKSCTEKPTSRTIIHAKTDWFWDSFWFKLIDSDSEIQTDWFWETDSFLNDFPILTLFAPRSMIFHHFYQPNLSTINLSTIFHLPHGTLVLLVRNIFQPMASVLLVGLMTLLQKANTT